MAHSLTTIGVHLECAIQVEMVVELELALIVRKQSGRFWHKSIIYKKATKGFGSVPRSKKTSNMVQFRLLFTKLRHFQKLACAIFL